MLISAFKTIFFVFLLFIAEFSVVHASGIDLLKQVDEVRAPGADFSFKVKVSASDGTVMTMNVSMKDNTKGLVQYVAPKKTVGRVILFVGRNMWIYIPGSRRALRISPQQQVLGGVSSADIARTVYSIDYAVAGVDQVKGGQLLHLTAKSQSAAYGKVDLTVNMSAEPQMAVFFTKNGKRKLKTVYFEDYRVVLGRERPTKLRVIDHLSGDDVTIISYSAYEIKDTPAAWFQPSYLSRL